MISHRDPHINALGVYDVRLVGMRGLDGDFDGGEWVGKGTVEGFIKHTLKVRTYIAQPSMLLG